MKTKYKALGDCRRRSMDTRTVVNVGTPNGITAGTIARNLADSLSEINFLIIVIKHAV